jgi:Flp pilus assembly protein TadB
MNRTTQGARRVRPAAKGLVSGASGLVVALVVALGIPLAWVWIASQLAGTRRELTPSLAILITTGILLSYWLALVCGGWLRSRAVGDDTRRAQVRRASWNRSFRDEYRPGQGRTDPVERLFIVVALIAIVLFEVWFFFFAGSPLPNQPAF